MENLKQRWDVVSSRAFASLVDFTNWSRQALAEEGVWLAMKGRHPADEIVALPADIELFHVEPLQVPGWTPSAASSGCGRNARSRAERVMLSGIESP